MTLRRGMNIEKLDGKSTPAQHGMCLGKHVYLARLHIPPCVAFH